MTILFKSGVEPGNFTEFDDTTVDLGCSLTADTAQLHHGQYSIRGQVVANGNARARKLTAGNAELFYYLWVCFNALPSVGMMHSFAQLRDDAGADVFRVGMFCDVGPVYRFFLTDSAFGWQVSANIPMSAGVWYRFKIRVLKDAVAGIFQAWRDDVLLLNLGGNTGAQTIGRIGVGNIWSTEASTIWVDCLIVATDGPNTYGCNPFQARKRLLGVGG